MPIAFKNIRNVRQLPETPPAYLCELDLKLSDEDAFSAVECCARPGGGGICDAVVAAIAAGDFQGAISDGSPTTEQHWQDVRRKRGDLLRESDIEVLPDRWAAMTPEQQQAWATYRQALRDLPDTCEDPAAPVWPVKPGD